MPSKRGNKFGAAGQASVEYLLTFAAVFTALAGLDLLFTKQVNRYLDFLLDWMTLPF